MASPQTKMAGSGIQNSVSPAEGSQTVKATKPKKTAAAGSASPTGGTPKTKSQKSTASPSQSPLPSTDSPKRPSPKPNAKSKTPAASTSASTPPASPSSGTIKTPKAKSSSFSPSLSNSSSSSSSSATNFRLRFDGNTTVGQMLSAAQRLGVAGCAEMDVLQLILALKDKLDHLAAEMENSDPDVRILQDVLPLFIPDWTNEDNDLYYVMLFNLLWTFLLPPSKEQPIRTADGMKRLMDADFEEVVPKDLSALRKFIDNNKLSQVSKRVGGKGETRTTEIVRLETIQAMKEKTLNRAKAKAKAQEKKAAKAQQSGTAFSPSSSSSSSSSVPIRAESNEQQRGAYGVVTKVLQPPKGSFPGGYAAVKRPRNRAAHDRIRNEIQIFERLAQCGGHPNIVHCISYSRETPELCLEYLEMNLLEAINSSSLPFTTTATTRREVFDEAERKEERERRGNGKGEAEEEGEGEGEGETEESWWHPLTVLLDIARGLEFLHYTADLIHIDLKDKNVMLDKYGRAKLIDFDCAQRPLTEEEVRLGLRRLNCTSSSVADPQLTKRRGIFSFEVDVYNWADIAKWLVRGITDDTETTRQLQELIERCQLNDIRRRPTSMDLASQMSLMISNYRDRTGRQVSSALPQSDLQYARALCAAVPDIPPEEIDVLFVQNENFAASLARSADRVDCMCRIATFNTKNLGPDPEKVQRLAEFIVSRGIDIIALQEVRGRDKGRNSVRLMLAETLERLGRPDDQWQVELSNPLSPTLERGLFAFKGSHVRIMSQCVLDEVGKHWSRKPFFGKFRIGRTKFLICSVHLDPTTPQPQIRDLSALCLGLKEEGAIAPDTRVLVLGDFNAGANDPSFATLRQAGWSHCLPSGLRTNKSDKNRKQYDNIFVNQASTDSVLSVFTDEAGLKISDHALVYIDHVFSPGNDASDTAILPTSFAGSAGTKSKAGAEGGGKGKGKGKGKAKESEAGSATEEKEQQQPLQEKVVKPKAKVK